MNNHDAEFVGKHAFLAADVLSVGWLEVRNQILIARNERAKLHIQPGQHRKEDSK